MGGKGNRDQVARSKTGGTRAQPGRPPRVSEEALLRGALRLFAEFGYEGMSVRLLNQQLGISHNTVNKRFGSKLDLWYAAVDQGFSILKNDLAPILSDLQAAAEPRDVARYVIVAGLRASLKQPDILRLMNYEGARPSERLSYIFRAHLDPIMSVVHHALKKSAEEGTIRPVSARAIMFLLAHGAAAPFTLSGLSSEYDGLSGPLDEEEHIELMADFLIAGLYLD